VPLDRVAAVIGKKGETKKHLEEACHVSLEVDSQSGEITVRSASVEEGDPFRATNVVEAVGRGFSPQRALKLVDPETIAGGPGPEGLRREERQQPRDGSGGGSSGWTASRGG
jgi:rRNA processing protein Krr1/Pno1